MGSSVAAIFDMDGVVVDTVASLYAIYAEILGGFGARATRGEFDRLNGSNLDEIVSHLAQEHGLLGRENEIRNRFETSFGQLYARVDLVRGIVPVLETLKKNSVTICLASSSSRSNIDAALQRFGLSRFFDSIVSGDEVERAKPHPEIYKLAKERCPCNEHFVIEDSPNGIEAAQRAGLVAVFYNPGQEPDRKRASYDIANLSEIPRILLEDRAVIVSRSARIEIARDDRRHPISAQDEHRADEIWNAGLKENPSLVHSDVTSYRSHKMLPSGDCVIACGASQYKYVFAKLRDRRLTFVTPIGVSGVVIDKNGRVLLGRRSKDVSEYGGHYEFVPSGGITTPNMAGELYLEEIKGELTEETGIGAENIQSMTPFCLVYDRIHGVFDIGVKLTLACDIDPAALASKEYAKFVLLDTDSLGRFLREEPVVPTTEAMYSAMMKP